MAQGEKQHIVLRGVKVVLPLLVIGVLYYQLKDEWPELTQHFSNMTWKASTFILLIVAIFLMMLNWTLESIKWQFLIRDIHPISLKESIQSILNGIAFGLITPFKIGEVMSRIMHLQSEDRKRSLGSLLLSRAAQLSSTILVGLVAFGNFSITYLQFPITIWIVLAVLFILTLYIYFNLGSMVPWLDKVPVVSNYIHYIDVMNEYSLTTVMGTLTLSMARYFVFVSQYFFIFQFLGLNPSISDIMLGIPVVMLIKSIIPLTILGDVGVREVAAVAVFGVMGYFKPMILLGTLLIWVINILLPSFIGSFFSKNLKV